MSSVAKVEEDIFPREADLEALVRDGCFESLRMLLREEGVFVSCHKEELAKVLSRYLFRDSFYRDAFGQVHRKEHGLSLTGVRFNRKDLSGVYEHLLARRNVPLAKNNYHPRVVSVTKNSETSLEIGIQYDKINSKYTAYNRREIYEFSAMIECLPDKSFEIRASQAINTDSVVLRDLAHDIIRSIKAELLDVDLSSLPVTGRVDLFDAIVRDDAKNAWRIDKSCGFSIRRGEQEAVAFSTKEASILHRAILDGENLRDHEVVKKLVADHYYFSSVTFMTFHKSEPLYQVRVKVDFKQNPTILVVTAESARVVSKDDKFETRAIEKDKGQKCIEYFWSFVHSLYSAETKKTKSQAKKVVRIEDSTGKKGAVEILTEQKPH